MEQIEEQSKPDKPEQIFPAVMGGVYGRRGCFGELSLYHGEILLYHKM